MICRVPADDAYRSEGFEFAHTPAEVAAKTGVWRRILLGRFHRPSERDVWGTQRFALGCEVTCFEGAVEEMMKGAISWNIAHVDHVPTRHVCERSPGCIDGPLAVPVAMDEIEAVGVLVDGTAEAGRAHSEQADFVFDKRQDRAELPIRDGP